MIPGFLRFKKISILSLILFCNFYVTSGQDNLSIEDISVLKSPVDTMMKSYLIKVVDRQFAVRDSLLSTLKSASDWAPAFRNEVMLPGILENFDMPQIYQALFLLTTFDGSD